MSNRLLSLLILTLIIGGLFGVYYYFFALNTANVSLIINGSGTVSITLTSEFGSHSLYEWCERTCLFENIPAVNYTVSAKREGYIPFTKNFTLHWGETKKVMIMMEKEVILTEQKRKKEDTIAILKLQKSIQDTLETSTGGITLGYRTSGMYYALPDKSGWSVFVKKEWSETRELFKIPEGILTPESLDIYEGYIALKRWENVTFHSLSNGTAMYFAFDEKILSIKDTLDDDTKIITSDTGVFMYSVSEKTAHINPLYDDIIQLASGEIVALVKKTSKAKQSLLSIANTADDSVFLIGRDTRERSLLFQTPKNGKLLRYKNGEILFIDEDSQVFVVSNVK